MITISKECHREQKVCDIPPNPKVPNPLRPGPTHRRAFHPRSSQQATARMLPPQSSSRLSPSASIAILLLLLIAFFPSLFHSLWTLPLSIFHVFRSSPERSYTSTGIMTWEQKQFFLPPKSRGSYLVTDHVVGCLPELRHYKVGLLNLFIQHTSCALSMNENCR